MQGSDGAGRVCFSLTLSDRYGCSISDAAAVRASFEERGTFGTADCNKSRSQDASRKLWCDRFEQCWLAEAAGVMHKSDQPKGVVPPKPQLKLLQGRDATHASGRSAFVSTKQP